MTPSIIFPPISEELRLQASEEDQKLNYSTQVCIIHPPKVTMYRQEWIKTKKESYSASEDKKSNVMESLTNRKPLNQDIISPKANFKPKRGLLSTPESIYPPSPMPKTQDQLTTAQRMPSIDREDMFSHS